MEEVSRGAGYRREVPCAYHLYEPKVYCINKMREYVDTMSTAGML